MKIAGCVAILAAAIGSAAHGQYAQWTGSDMSIGKGYDSFLHKARGRCVDHDPKGPVPVAGEDLKFELQSVENESSLFNKLGISVAAKYGVAKGSASYSRETSINRYSVYFYISGNIEVGKESVTAPDLTIPKIRPGNYKQLDERSIDKFRETCGNTYISGMSYGGKYIALVEIKTKKDSEIQDIQVAVSGSAGGFSGSANAKLRLEQATQNKEVRIKVLRGAGDGAVIPTTIEGLTAAVTKFPESLRGLPTRKLQPFDVTVEDYITLDTPSTTRRSDFSTIDEEEYVDNADRFVVRHRTAMANAAYAIANGDEFPGVDKNALQSYIDDAEPVVLRVITGIRKCLEGSVNCKDFVAPTLAVVNPPTRTDGPSRIELEASIAKSRQAIDSVILPENNELSKYCSNLAAREGRGSQDWVGCIIAMRQVKKLCDERGCRP